MSSILTGKHIQVSVFGQSHSKAIGAVIDGLPAGVKIDSEKVAAFMRRRAPGNAKYATKRREADESVVLSGLVDGVTCGAPLGFLIENTNTRSGDYDNLRAVPRPGHADYTANVRYGGYQDVAGGGHFSGRLTAPLCFAGAVCMQILEQKGVKVQAHIYEIAGVQDVPFDPITITNARPGEKAFPVISDASGEAMQAEIEKARMSADSVGGIVECAVTGMPAGLGDPMFDGVENQLASNIFAVPAVKGLEFGNGFACAKLRGSQNNDPYTIDENGKIVTTSNNHGGILGGITSGMPILFRVAVKPTSSIGQEQQSVNLHTNQPEKLVVHGRHDPCIVPRAVPVIEAVTAITILDILGF